MASMEKAFDISKLMSPPDQEMIDSFSSANFTADTKHLASLSPEPQLGPSQNAVIGNGSRILRSEMISPVSMDGDEVESVDNGSARDPILYPESTHFPHSRPLFADNEAVVALSHLVSRSPALFQQVYPPCREAYERGICIKSQVMRSYIANPQDWLAQQKEQLRADSRAATERAERLRLPTTVMRSAQSQLPPRKPVSRTPKLQSVTQPVPNLTPPNKQPAFPRPLQDSTKRVAKRASHIVTISRTAIPPRIAPQPKDTPHNKSGAIRATLHVPGSSSEPRVRTSTPNREDRDFGSLPDYCPSLSTLPERTNLLKVEWKGSPLDLSHDPFRHLLHADELGLAAGLRLDCATYLTSKRRIFIRRLECARIPKEFRKTDAQQACKIDVNKASKLWSAFDKVGWLHIDQIRKFL
ncbi:hypothetical protein SEPCBS57363_005388 [Sporothrix epigloea]|uniref:SWIRM domain-containing protein n=1 Tax=Sporothrix epigloea TaxID=1892477 RepID=A0ABP0DX88_9PEZI